MMIRSAAALLLALLISRAVPRARARGHGTAAAFPRYTGQQPPYPETNQASASVRSLEMDNFKAEEVPEINKSNSPVILKLYPPVVKPEAVHANRPLRFGRSSPRGALWLLRSPLTLTRRLGRSSETDSSIALACHQCGRAGGVAAPSVTHPQRFGRTNRFYNPALPSR
ncbi:hypothetical protein COCON_G00124840 [Conger conger]|uniref:Uncharacterized protein n=1 Tax=Conger conger TaxID=82655 RepID=A0A9Q1HWP1_CONCO|nr:pro-FMRFamide-related neuropeptide VF [Conger conger]KAJ8267312.1 hypothetical protein COCON_G00124840 [Conger conger]